MADLLHAAFGRMLEASLHGGVMALLVLSAQCILGSRLSPRWRCAIWGLVFLRLTLPALPATSWSVMNLTPAHPAPAETVETITFGVITSTTAPLMTQTPGTAAPPANRRSILPQVWLLVAALLIARHAVASVRLARRIRKLPRTVAEGLPIVETDLVAGPALFGIFRPVLLLPPSLKAELSDTELRFIMQHEMAHLRRHDVLVGWVTSIITAIHWFNPVIWLASAQFRAERELACDASVLAKAQATERAVYGETILKLLERFPRAVIGNPSTVGLIGSRRAVRRRIAAVAAFAPRRSIFCALLGLIAFIIVGCGAFSGDSGKVIPSKSLPNLAIEGTVTHVYDVSDVIIEVTDFGNAPELGVELPVVRSSSQRPTTRSSATQQENSNRDQKMQELIKRIMDEVDPPSWRARSGTVGAMTAHGSELIITQTQANLEAIQLLLQELRGTRDVQVTVEVRFITGAAFKQLEKMGGGKHWQTVKGVQFWPGYLNDGEVKSLLRSVQASRDSTLITAPRITLFNGQRAYVLVSRQTAFVGDLKPSTTQPGEYEPVIGVAHSGVLLDCQASVSADQKNVAMTLRPQLSTLLDLVPEPWPGTPAGKTLTIQVPYMAITKLETTTSIPNDQTALFRLRAKLQPAASTQLTPEPVLMMIRPKIVIAKEGEQPLPKVGSRPVTQPAKR
jgi:bla regulator protein BlaR1